jgi:hypothetical protein
MSGQPGNPFCLKASNNASPSAACADNGSALTYSNSFGIWQPWWQDGSTDTNGAFYNGQYIDGTSNKFRLPSPQSSAASFGTIDLILVQHPKLGETADNWNIQGISVIVSDSRCATPDYAVAALEPRYRFKLLGSSEGFARRDYRSLQSQWLSSTDVR